MISIVGPFDPKCDVSQVDQFGWLDLRKAYVEGVVQGDLVVDEEGFNDIEDARAIVGKPRDVFEAMEMGTWLGTRTAAAAPSSEKDNAE